MLTFTVIGPFDLPCESGKTKRLSSELNSPSKFFRTSLWEEVQKDAEKLGINDFKKAKGLYVFGLRNRGLKPYYVGKSLKQPLHKEAFNDRNLRQFDRVISDSKGTPVIFFLLLPVRRGPDNSSVVSGAERFLIEHAFSRNPDRLINKQHAKEHDWSIDGVVRTSGSGRRGSAASQLKVMLGI